MKRVFYIVFLLLTFVSCSVEDSIENRLTGGGTRSWIMTQRWVNDELELNSDSVIMEFNKDEKQISVNGYSAQYELLYDTTVIYFEYPDEQTFALELKVVSDTLLEYQLQGCSFETVKERLIRYDN